MLKNSLKKNDGYNYICIIRKSDYAKKTPFWKLPNYRPVLRVVWQYEFG